ncbi:MAG TPA: hypothetical protein VGP44_04145, partial [Gemmatimonadales bacterium]|nr:hypothetical protein [Gemmatimonadales bacterium]
MRITSFYPLAPLLTLLSLMTTGAEGVSVAVVPMRFVTDTPTVRLTLAQVKARLAAGTEEKAPDLSRADLSGLDLHGVDFKRA